MLFKKLSFDNLVRKNVDGYHTRFSTGFSKLFEHETIAEFSVPPLHSCLISCTKMLHLAKFGKSSHRHNVIVERIFLQTKSLVKYFSGWQTFPILRHASQSGLIISSVML